MPNQHGAWAMLASPLLVGMVAGGFAWVDLPLAAFWFVGYLAFFATSLWLKSGRRAKWFPPVRAYSLLAAGLGLVVVAMDPALLRWAPAFVLPLGIGLWAAAHRHERDLLAGLATVLASGLVTVVAYDAGGTGPLTRGWQLGAVQFLYFAGTVFYVKTVIRERDNPAFLRLSVAVHAASAAAMAWLSWWLVAVFALLTARAAVVPRLRPTPRQVGIGEIASTVVVAVVSLLVV
ncbi:MAG TPA: YwiC-like family protein [Nocardioides sp.]|uniref:YwiC-like family protein n=1 Tax=Nocardioides sp. TaxID=35761 RepID=UPI002CB54A07|nr:YwiC-like family protein [Nocardioides sp.]HQR27117.1 YwiC-like family protein [Nocardioides sp.]